MMGYLLIGAFFVIAMSIIVAATLCSILDSDYKVKRWNELFNKATKK